MRDERVRGSGLGSVGARNGLTERKSYVASERDARQEPPEVTAARERHRALTAEINRRRVAQEERLDAMAKAARGARERDG